MKSDIVIIGGGVTGLATGALLAKDGRSVVVLEKGNQAGGRAYAYEDKGFTLNYGPHAIYRPNTGILHEVLDRIGAPGLSYGYPDAVRSFWADGDRFGSVGAKPHQVLTTKLFPLPTRARLLPLMTAIRFAKPEKLGDQTYGEWVEEHISDARLRRFANALGTVNTYTRPAAKLSATFLIGHLQRNMFAKDYVGYMSGGWRAMYERFVDALQSNGGSLITGAHVERLEIEDGHIVAAVTAGARYEAAAFVSTLPPRDAPALQEGASPLAEELRQYADIEDVHALCMDLGFSRRLRTDLSYIFDVNEDLYYSLHSEVTPDLAPEGSQLLHAMAYLSPEEAADEHLRSARHAALVAGLDRWFAGWREALVVDRTLPNVRVATLRQSPANRARRLPLRSASTANLYFAGDASDIEGNLTEICFLASVRVANALAAVDAGRQPAPTLA